MEWTPPRRRLAAVVLAGLAPWTVLFIGDELSVLFTFGIFNTNPVHLTPVYDFFFRYTDGLPQFLDSWGIGVFLYLVGLASAVSGVVWREDERVTAAVLAFAALSQLWVAAGFDRRLGYTAVPVGTLVLLTVVWWHYWPALRRTFTFDRA
jgi:uncharacterized protein (TIGR04206 family)